MQEKAEVEVTLPALHTVTGKPPESPTSVSPLLGDVTIEECFTSKKIVIKVEHSPPPDVGKKSKVSEISYYWH